MSIIVRPASETDIDEITRIGAQAFPGMDAAGRAERIQRHPLAHLEHNLVAEEAGLIVGTATVAPRRMWWGGSEWDMGGLASVAVAPEARRRGAARALCDAVLDRLREQGVPLCLLYPFDTLFYSELGWSLVAQSRRLTINCSHLPRYECPSIQFLRELINGEAIRQCHQQWLKERGIGLVRHATVWEKLFHQPEWQWFGVPSDDNGLDGYLACKENFDPLTATSTLEVGEMIALTPRARREMLGFLRNQEAQCLWVQLEVSEDTPIECLLDRTQAKGLTHLHNGHFLSSQICTGAMVKVLDWGMMLGNMEPRGTWLRRTVSVGIADGPRWRLNIDGRWVEVDKDNSDLRVTSDEQTLTKIAWGAMTMMQAHEWGLVTIEGKEEDLEAVSASLTGPSLFIPRWDGF